MNKEINQFKEITQKISNTFSSCKTIEQTRTAEKYCQLLIKYSYNLFNKSNFIKDLLHTFIKTNKFEADLQIK